MSNDIVNYGVINVSKRTRLEGDSCMNFFYDSAEYTIEDEAV